MDNHFAWWYLSNQALNVHRLTDDLITTSLHYSPKRRERFLHGRALLAELMFQLYGYEKLPRLAVAPSGRPCFVDPTLPDFSLGYAGSVIALMLGTNGKVGMDVEIIRARQGGFIHLQQQYITSGEKFGSMGKPIAWKQQLSFGLSVNRFLRSQGWVPAVCKRYAFYRAQENCAQRSHRRSKPLARYKARSRGHAVNHPRWDSLIIG